MGVQSIPFPTLLLCPLTRGHAHIKTWGDEGRAEGKELVAVRGERAASHPWILDTGSLPPVYRLTGIFSL